MRLTDYSPRRRTALVLAGSGTSGAYHAGVLKALDESGVKVDLVVGSGAGAVAAAFAAAAGGPKLYGADGFWDGVTWASFYRLRAGLRIAVLLLACSFGVFLLPVTLALLAGVLFPLALVLDMVVPGLPTRLTGLVTAAPAVLRAPYLAALALPIFMLSVIAFFAALRLLLRQRRRVGESFESLLDTAPARRRVAERLWEIARGSALSKAAPSEVELGRKYVGLVAENLGQPGFRELIVRTADLETGDVLPFVVLDDAHRAAFAAARGQGTRSRVEGLPGAIDLRAPGYDALAFDAVVTSVLPPGVAAPHRVSFPKGGLFAGETHRLTDGTLAAGCGIAEAVAAGAQQVIVAAGVPESATPPARRRGAWALADGLVATLERQGVETEVAATERINRLVETLGHRTDEGGRAWQDPGTGRTYRPVALYVIRPERRLLGPLELDGSLDPATEVEALPDDLIAQGYRDAYRLFIEPVVGAVPEPPPARPPEVAQPVEL